MFLKKFDIGVKFITSPEPEAFAEAIDDNTRAIYIESIGNPKNTVALLPEIAKVDAMGGFLPHVGITDLFRRTRWPTIMVFPWLSTILLAWEVRSWMIQNFSQISDTKLYVEQAILSALSTMAQTSSRTVRLSGSGVTVPSWEAWSSTAVRLHPSHISYQSLSWRAPLTRHIRQVRLGGIRQVS